MIRTSDLSSLRRHLERERARILGSRRRGPNLDPGRNPDRADLASETMTRHRQSALRSMERDQLTQIEAALRRMDDGVYGRCLICGEAIPVVRLAILPHATHCVGCQQRAD